MSNSRNLADLLDANGDVSLGDNVKAKFGASDDLQIYSVGNTSYIHETGSGDFYIKGSSIYVTDSSNNQFIHCNDTGTGGTVSLKHGGSTKLNTTATGIDVTGSVTCYGLDLGNSQYISLKNSSNVSTRSFGINNVNNMYIGGIDAAIGSTLFVNNGAEVMRIDSAGNVGIGTTSPTSPLHIQGSGHTALAITGGTGSDAQIRFGDSDNTNIGMINYDNAVNALKFVVNSAESMRIDSTGNVGIGTNAPTVKLDVVGSVRASELRTSGHYHSIKNLPLGKYRFTSSIAHIYSAKFIFMGTNMSNGTTNERYIECVINKRYKQNVTMRLINSFGSVSNAFHSAGISIILSATADSYFDVEIIATNTNSMPAGTTGTLELLSQQGFPSVSLLQAHPTGSTITTNPYT